jgi:thioredoxin reductase (NADPH)
VPFRFDNEPVAIRDVLIVGAGPSGLATAIAARQAGLDYLVVEKGVLVNSIFNFPTHMVFFTTPELLEIGGLPLVTPFEKPTRFEALRYYRRVVDTYALRISCHEEVVDIQREPGEGIFAVATRTNHGVDRVRHARAVVLAIGYYDRPNYLGVPGEDLPHVSHYYKEAHPHYRQRVVVVGGRNSAAETSLELYRAGAHVTLVHWGPTLGDTIKYWVRPDIENRIKEGSIAARFEARVVEIRPTEVVIDQKGRREVLPADAVYLMTGYHPDADLMRRAGIEVDPVTLAPTLDAETFETNVPNLFLAGGCVAGRQTGSIFIENGRFHGEKIVKVLADRLARVE